MTYIANLWDKALSTLKNEVNDQVFTSWFLPIRQLSFENNVLTLSVPNKFFETWIREHHEKTILDVLSQITNQAIELSFVISLTSGPEPASSISPTDAQEPGKKADAVGWLKNVFSSNRALPESEYQKIGLNPKNTFDNFVVGQSNRFAHAASLAISENPAKTYNPFFLHGGVGLGKTHLLQAIGHEILSRFPKMKLLYISSEEFTNQLIKAIRNRTTIQFRNMYRNVDVLLIDDIQFIAGKDSTQEEFFHTFNKLYDSHKQIVVTSDRSPKEIPKMEDRLVSRFEWGLRADVQVPDFETRIAIFEKKCEAEKINIPKDVVYFLAENISSNIREMEGALIRVTAYSKLSGEALSVELAKEILKGMLTETEKKITIPDIQLAVCSFFGISKAEMTSKKRTQAIARPRQVAMFLSRKLTEHSFPEIGAHFGGRDHTTAIHAFEKIRKEIEKNPEVRGLVNKLVTKIKK